MPSSCPPHHVFIITGRSDSRLDEEWSTLALVKQGLGATGHSFTASVITRVGSVSAPSPFHFAHQDTSTHLSCLPTSHKVAVNAAQMHYSYPLKVIVHQLYSMPVMLLYVSHSCSTSCTGAEGCVGSCSPVRLHVCTIVSTELM